MTRRHTLAAALVALAMTTLAPGATPASAAPAAESRAPATPTLVGVEARHVGNVDRVVFSFSGGVPKDVDVAWVDTLFADGSGFPVRVAGTKVLSVVFNRADAHDQDGSTVKRRTSFALPNVITAVQAGDFEAMVTVGLGVQKRTAYKVRTKPGRVVVDVAAGFRTATRKVWFIDRDAVQTGTEPYAVPVNRPVPAAAPATAVLHSLFAGPTPSEAADGLRLVRSGAWGFSDLEIADGIARLRLTRGCGSGGSTVTVADEIGPTLKQFPTVDWVKIYAPGGQTAQAGGQVDSVPGCLEP